MTVPAAPLLRSACALVLFAGVAAAAPHDEHEGPWYLTFGAGATGFDESNGPNGNVTLDTGLALHSTVGRRFGSGGLTFSLEGEALYMNQKLDTPVISPASSDGRGYESLTFFANAMLELDLTDKLSVYGGGGVGVSTMSDLSSTFTAISAFDVQDDNPGAWQAKIGAKYRLGSNYSWFAQYRRFQGEELRVADNFLGQSFTFENTANAFEIGARWDL